MKGHKTATVLGNALELVLPDAGMRAGFKTWMAENAQAGGKTFLLMDSGRTVDRCLIASGMKLSINAERDLRTGAGFKYTDPQGKSQQKNLHDLGILFTRHSSIEDGVYGWPTLTAETAGEKRYDSVMGRKAKVEVKPEEKKEAVAAK